MIRLFIDGQLAEIEPDSQIAVSLSIASITDPESSKVGYTKTIKIPITPINMKIMGGADQTANDAAFNAQNHQAYIEAEGCRVIEGSVQLLGVNKNHCNNRGYYSICIIGAGKMWAQKAAQEMFNKIPIEFSMTINENSILSSWTDNSPVKFLPVNRLNSTSASTADKLLLKPTNLINTENYHPFLHVKTLMEKIIGQSGYSISSEFMNTDFFNSLYMSGMYPSKDISRLKSRMNFKAGRFAAATATANSYGTVYADPAVTISSIGNIVDTANSYDTDENGNPAEGVFNTNDCFQMIGTRMAFVPTQEVTMRFEYYFEYTSEYYLKSREELTGFNIINLGEQESRSFKIINRFTDRRNNITPNKQYNLVLFDHGAYLYMIIYELDGVTVSQSTANRSTFITIEEGAAVTNFRIYYINKLVTYEYEGDWALYDGHIKENGTIDISTTLRSYPEKITPSSPKYFNYIYFGGADEGMEITLSAATSIKPVFMASPGYGSSIAFEDVAAHQVNQIAFVNAVKHMFNLCFYTDSIAKTVYIEPRPDFFDRNTVIDWTDRIDRERNITVEELGAEMYSNMTFRYQNPDGAVSAWNSENETTLGAWTAQIDNVFAKDGTYSSINPMFAPAVHEDGVLEDAPSAIMIKVGEENEDDEGEMNMNFPAKIIAFAGMETLPDGELWGWPSYSAAYPKAFFHLAGENGASLCFEDRDEMEGLHRFYDTNINSYNNGRRITAYLFLKPTEIEQLLEPNSLKLDFRAMFKLRIDGEVGLYYLEEICDFAPANNKSTKCIFIKYA